MEWTEITLGDHIEVLTDYHANGAYEKLKANVELKSEKDFAVMIRTLNFERGDFEKELIYINEKEYDFLAKSKVYPGDILMNKIADAGSVYCMPDLNCPVSLAMNLFLIRLKPSLNQKFMYYMMKFYEPYIKLYANGAATLTITKDSVRKLKFNVPDIDPQNKIVALVSTYDDLIENNLKRIKLLEEMAQITYEEWFLRMKFPGHETAVFDEETGLPKGWTKGLLSEITQFQFGFAFDSSLFNEAKYGNPLVRIRNIPSSQTNIYSPEKVEDKYIINTGDLLVGMDGEFYLDHWQNKPAYLVQRVCNIKPYNKLLLGYLKEALRAPIKFYESTISGATVAHLGKKHLDEIEIICPSETEMKFFDNLLRNRLNLFNQNELLKEARDILLPRLMTDMIDIEQVELPEAMLKRLEQQEDKMATAI